MTSSLADHPFAHVSAIAHADWSINPAKRWVSIASHRRDGHWRVDQLVNLKDPSELFGLPGIDNSEPGCTLIGFDFPIGLPRAYAEKVGIADYLSFLASIRSDYWSGFFVPAESESEISLRRPFYPEKPGYTKRANMESRLGIPFAQLSRLCEMRQSNRRAACPLFWTMGPQQVGKAAISGWRDVLIPGLSNPQLNLRIWPFSGTLVECCHPGNHVVVETYPAEYYSHLGISFTSPTRKSKRRQSDRLSFSEILLGWASTNQVELEISIEDAIRTGFGAGLDGEDRFDTLVGLFGMLNLVLGNHLAQEPCVSVIRSIEGWIFGQSIPGE